MTLARSKGAYSSSLHGLRGVTHGENQADDTIVASEWGGGGGMRKCTRVCHCYFSTHTSRVRVLENFRNNQTICQRGAWVRSSRQSGCGDLARGSALHCPQKQQIWRRKPFTRSRWFRTDMLSVAWIDCPRLTLLDNFGWLKKKFFFRSLLIHLFIFEWRWFTLIFLDESVEKIKWRDNMLFTGVNGRCRELAICREFVKNKIGRFDQHLFFIVT